MPPVGRAEVLNLAAASVPAAGILNHHLSCSRLAAARGEYNTWEVTMNRRNILNLSAITVLGLVMSTNVAMAQTKSLKDQLIGSWILVSAEPYGTNPNGSYMFDANGRFSAILMRNDLPKYTSNNRTQATPAEYKGTVDGSIAYFGTYSISGTDLDLHIEGSTFANGSGTVQKRTNVSVAGNELKYSVPAPSDARVTNSPTVWKRAK
jgi:hypothetical protein